MTLVVNQSVVQDSLSIKAVWSEIRADSCPYHYNFHLHTRCSDGQLTPKQVVEQAIALGLKGFAITDHHCLDGFQIAWDYLTTIQPSINLPQLWTGIEITTNLAEVEVHILGYAFEPGHPALTPYVTGKRSLPEEAVAERVIPAIHQAGGLAVLAHPARYHRPPEQLIPQVAHLGIDAIEVYYAYGNPKPWFPSPTESEDARKLASQYGLLMTCGTDTHGTSLLQRI
ncbi:PHP domain-containing protein [Gloeocapsa sp. PCC 73106]|uniref:PHP domain-containing protein n=1 Tax=Gloeocapsa sp. PCC 73106 TaxID=102232 RepID=UPI0002AD05D6|nr:PHP domain-containing protein [Gloeocapsa sp. PCC 73106]ELR99878.1 putative metal-dependent phosphoesterase, PHP family [Gloeocapsa sp. PCC 73106]